MIGGVTIGSATAGGDTEGGDTEGGDAGNFGGASGSRVGEACSLVVALQLAATPARLAERGGLAVANPVARMEAALSMAA
jgi:hypothetical protein